MCNLVLQHKQMCFRQLLKHVCLSPQVYLKAPMILNGVCVIWRGWIDLQRLDGMGYLEYDQERAQVSSPSHTKSSLFCHFSLSITCDFHHILNVRVCSMRTLWLKPPSKKPAAEPETLRTETGLTGRIWRWDRWGPCLWCCSLSDTNSPHQASPPCSCFTCAAQIWRGV